MSFFVWKGWGQERGHVLSAPLCPDSGYSWQPARPCPGRLGLMVETNVRHEVLTLCVMGREGSPEAPPVGWWEWVGGRGSGKTS